MQKEKVQQFTLRITESNRTQLVAIMYDMIDEYFADAVAAKERDDAEEFKKNVRNADRVIKELTDILDHKYEIAGNLYSLYTYCRERLAYSLMKYDASGISEADKVLKALGQSFRELAKQDDSKPLMQNTQKVSYGVTYGKSDVSESLAAGDANRGYFA